MFKYHSSPGTGATMVDSKLFCSFCKEYCSIDSLNNTDNYTVYIHSTYKSEGDIQGFQGLALSEVQCHVVDKPLVVAAAG